MTRVDLKTVFNQVSYLNPRKSEVSSIGEFIEQSAYQMADYAHKEIIGYLPENSLAYKIMLEKIKGGYTDKQLWVIAYELIKNEDYCRKLEDKLEAIDREQTFKKAVKKAKKEGKLQAKKDFNSKMEKIEKEVATYNVGDVVEHSRFGQGTIIKFDGENVTVEFENETKTLVAKFAPLKKM